MSERSLLVETFSTRKDWSRNVWMASQARPTCSALTNMFVLAGAHQRSLGCATPSILRLRLVDEGAEHHAEHEVQLSVPR